MITTCSDFKEETISLKTLLEEARRIVEVKKVQMIKKEEDCEKPEQEVVSLRKSLRNSQVPKYFNTSWMHG
jgi:hypothetical protein